MSYDYPTKAKAQVAFDAMYNVLSDKWYAVDALDNNNALSTDCYHEFRTLINAKDTIEYAIAGVDKYETSLDGFMYNDIFILNDNCNIINNAVETAWSIIIDNCEKLTTKIEAFELY